MDVTGVEAIKQVIPLSHLASQLGITKGAVSQWGNRIPISRLTEIERITGIHRSKLRPDLYSETS